MWEMCKKWLASWNGGVKRCNDEDNAKQKMIEFKKPDKYAMRKCKLDRSLSNVFHGAGGALNE
jgi:hypothetical protein